MIQFILKAIIRDKNRSLIPILVVAIGVFLTIALSGFLRGTMGDMIDQTARFQTGHVKVTTRAYAENIEQMPNDLAIYNVDVLVSELKQDFPNYTWVKRINFGGLIDVSTQQTTGKGQGAAIIQAIELFSDSNKEVERLNISNALVAGKLPDESGEILIGNEFAQLLGVGVGDELTFMGSTMNGSITFSVFTISGTLRFGIGVMDKSAILIDITDAQQIMDMENVAGEILGFHKDEIFFDEETVNMAAIFNKKYAQSDDEYAPIMLPLREQNSLGGYIDHVNSFSTIFVVLFVIVMSIVLWNTGLIGGLRRYQEFGIRLALGESKGHIYRSLIYEAALIGILGSLVGTMLGIALVLFMQSHGFDMSGMMSDSTMMMPNVMRAKFTPELVYIGFIPGVIAMISGNMLSGMGIYKRQTSTLIKEMEL